MREEFLESRELCDSLDSSRTFRVRVSRVYRVSFVSLVSRVSRVSRVYAVTGLLVQLVGFVSFVSSVGEVLVYSTGRFHGSGVGGRRPADTGADTGGNSLRSFSSSSMRSSSL